MGGGVVPYPEIDTFFDRFFDKFLIGPLIRASDMFFDTFSDKGN